MNTGHTTNLRCKCGYKDKVDAFKDGTCPHCDMDIAIRNPSGYCDHLYYPDNCDICRKRVVKEVIDTAIHSEEFIDKMSKVFDYLDVIKKIHYCDDVIILKGLAKQMDKRIKELEEI